MAIRLSMLALGLLACSSASKRQRVEDAPKWQDEPNAVRYEILEKLLDGEEALRATQLIQTMRGEGVSSARLDYYQSKALHQQNMLTEATSLIERALAAEPRVGEFHRQACVLAADQGRHSEALASCTRATELSPEDASAWNNLGYLLLTVERDEDQAIEALQRAVQLDGLEPRYRNNLATARVAAGQHKEAYQIFSTTFRSSDAAYNVGAAAERVGDTEHAVVYYRRALQESPGHSEAMQALDRLEADDAETQQEKLP